MNRVQVWVLFQQVLRPSPAHEGVNSSSREIGAQFVNERRGKDRVANAGQRDDQDVHFPTGLQPHDLLERGRGGLAGHEGNDHDLAASLLDGSAFVLVESVQSVITAFDIDIGLSGSQEPCSGRFGENASAVHAFQRGQHRRHA